MDRAEVHFSEEHTRKAADKEVCEVTLVGHGHHVRCKVSAPDGFAAVDKAVEKLEHQLHKLKTKLLRRSHQHTRRANGIAAEGEPGSVETETETEVDTEGGVQPRIVKNKAFQMK